MVSFHNDWCTTIKEPCIEASIYEAFLLFGRFNPTISVTFITFEPSFPRKAAVFLTQGGEVVGFGDGGPIHIGDNGGNPRNLGKSPENFLQFGLIYQIQ